MFATKLSSFRGCCYLGDVCDPVAANENFPNRPLTLEKIVCERYDDSEIINLAVPICSALERWKLYCRHGDDAFSTLAIAADGKLQYTVPRSEKSAHLNNTGRRPLVIPILTTVFIDRWVNCFHCLTFGYLLSVFSGCNQAHYCNNRDCQRLDWKTHRPKCYGKKRINDRSGRWLVAQKVATDAKEFFSFFHPNSTSE